MKHLVLLASCWISTLLSLSGQAQQVPDFLLKYERDGLPLAPTRQNLDSKLGVPVPPASQVLETDISVVAKPESDEERNEFIIAVKVATENLVVKALLDSNGRLLAGGPLPKPLGSAVIVEPQFLFTYYDYGKERAVEVIVEKRQVLSVRQREAGYQPPASPEEIVAAAEAVGVKFTSNLDISSVRAIAFAGPDGTRKLSIHGETALLLKNAIVVPAGNRVLKFQSMEKTLK